MPEAQTETKTKNRVAMLTPKQAAVGGITAQDIGQTVLYRDGSEVLPAFIVQVASDRTLTLCVLNPAGFRFFSGVEYSSRPKANYWSWPSYNNRIANMAAAA